MLAPSVDYEPPCLVAFLNSINQSVLLVVQSNYELHTA